MDMTVLTKVTLCEIEAQDRRRRENSGGQNTDPQSMDYPNGLPKWTTLKWTTPKNTISDYILTLHDLRGLQPPF